MKKIYLFFALFLSFGVVAQDDLSVALVSYTDGDATSDDPLDMDFIITNEGGTQLMDDTLWFALVFDASDYYYPIDLSDGPGYVGLIVLGADWLNGEEISIDADDALDMEWIYLEYGLGVEICAAAFGVGTQTEAFSGTWDATPADNIACVDYTVTEVDGIEELSSTIGSIFVADQFLKIQNTVAVSNATVQVSTLSGQIVQTEVLNLNAGLNEIEMTDVTSGIYMVSVTANGETTSTKVSVR